MEDYCKFEKYPYGLQPELTAILFYLATFSDRHDNVLKFDDGTPMTKDDIVNELSSIINNFDRWKMCPSLFNDLRQNSDGAWCLNRGFFNGRMAHKEVDQKDFDLFIRNEFDDISYAQLYVLGYTICIINFVNPYTLTLTNDVLETDPGKVRPIKMDELMNKLRMYTADRVECFKDALGNCIWSDSNCICSRLCIFVNLDGRNEAPLFNPYVFDLENDYPDKNMLKVFKLADDITTHDFNDI